MGTPCVSRLVATALLAATLAAPQLHAQRRTATATVTVPPLPQATPESVGFAPSLLANMDAAMQGLIDKKHLAGIVTLVARKGKVVQHKAYGYQDAESRTPMRTDTIARIYSMTKPITGVAMMMLFEDGKWKPSDPIAKHIPEFANLKVFGGEKDGAIVLEDPIHPPTMGELMSHTAGFTYGLFGNTPVDMIYRKNNPLAAPSLQAMIDRLATMPLLYQPGTRWVYSVGVDIQGYLVEKLSGQTFPEFLRTRLFEPLGMIDTAFSVPSEKMSRVAMIYAWDQKTGALEPQPHDPGINQLPGLPSGGGGLYGTAADYFRFAQMLLNGGEFNGRRILKKDTVEMMRTNVLSEQVLNSKSGIGQAQFSPAQGFGYDFAVVLDPAAAKRQVGKGSFWWWGIAGTWFWIDPANDVIGIGIIQRRGGVPGAANHEDLQRRVIYEALPPVS
ncbi:MAG TPA: serine hydrolase domain-containing protein [Vicinamibacterales bacterium]|nr:serine hydrolase domain-containing protein [Vicinamibacterales bacterium]